MTVSRITNNKDLLAVEHGTVMLNSNGDVLRMVRSNISPLGDILIMVTKLGKVSMIPVDDVPVDIEYSDEPYMVVDIPNA